jgi:hypothetical protein
MKRIFFNGCSYTYGRRRNEELEREERYENRWTLELSKIYDVEEVSWAIPGASNDWIVRTTMEWIGKNSDKVPSTAFVIGLTQPYRWEWFNARANEYEPKHPHDLTQTSVPDFTNRMKDLYGKDRTEDYKNLPGEGSTDPFLADGVRPRPKFYQQYLYYYYNGFKSMLESIRKIVMLQGYFKSLGVDYYFVSAFSELPTFISDVNNNIDKDIGYSTYLTDKETTYIPDGFKYGSREYKSYSNLISQIDNFDESISIHDWSARNNCADELGYCTRGDLYAKYLYEKLRPIGHNWL